MSEVAGDTAIAEAHERGFKARCDGKRLSPYDAARTTAVILPQPLTSELHCAWLEGWNQADEELGF